MKPRYDISPEEFDQIEQYLAGQLTASENSLFEKRIQEETEWAEKVKEVKLLVLGIKENELKTRLQSFHKQMNTTTSIKTEAPVRSMGSRRWLAAASILLVAALATWWMVSRQDPYEKLYSTYYTPDPGLPTTMSVAGNYQFDKGMVAFKSGDYKEALQIWTPISKTTPSNDTINYFLGVTQLALKQNDEALALLKPIANDANRPFYKDACWYTGLVLLRQGKPEAATPFIQKSNYPGSTELIQEINKK
ncbi:MAG: tetratricopeptide repeat protein [Chitinophagales bacterium]|nr:tetratricopeptide repeat protein [Chitinophagales bacterium]